MIDRTVIFSYRLGNAACCQYGQYEGFKIEIFYDGKIEYSEYVVQNILLKQEQYTLKSDVVEKILNVINESRIESIPENLDNGLCDGDSNEFFFYKNRTKYKITAWNIIDEEYNPEKGNDDKYKENNFYECEVMKIFNKISAIIKTSGFKMSLFSFDKIKNFYD